MQQKKILLSKFLLLHSMFSTIAPMLVLQKTDNFADSNEYIKYLFECEKIKRAMVLTVEYTK